MPLYIWDNTDQNIRVFSENTADGTAATAIRTFNIVGVGGRQSMTFDGTYLHLGDWSADNIVVISPNIADGGATNVIRTYTVSGLNSNAAIAFDGTNIHVADVSDDNIRVIAPNADAADTTQAIIRTYQVSGATSVRGLTFDGTNIHIADSGSDGVYVVAPPTGSGNVGFQTAVRTYTVNGLDDPAAMAFDGTNLHIADNNDDNMRVIAVPTHSGHQANVTILRTYTVTDVDEARGMTFVANTAPTFDQASYTFADIAIAVNTVVGTVTATDADNDPITYSLTGADAGNFAIDADGEITVSTELAEDSTYSFNVVANDGTVDVPMPVTVATVTPAPPTTATFTIEGPTDDIYAGQTVDFTITHNIDITGFTFDDIVLTGATFVSFTLTAERTWRYRVTADAGAGVISLIIREDSVLPGNNAATQTFTRNANPTVTITTADTDIRVGHLFVVRFEWSEDVTGFARGDITVTGGAASNFNSIDASTYTLAITAPDTAGDVVVTVDANAITERNAETSETFAVNALSTATLTPRATSIRGGLSTVVDVVFSEDVTHVNLSDFSVDVGSVSALTGSGDTYTVTVTAPESGTGTITLTLRERSVNPENAEATATIAYQPPPTVTMTPALASIRNGRSTTVMITFSEFVTGLTNADFSVNVGSMSNFTGSGANYLVTVTAPATGAGDITLTLAQNAVTLGNAETQATIAYEPLPTVAITSSSANIEPDDDFTVTFQWSEAVTGFATGDVTVTDATKGAFTAVDADTYTLALTAASTPGDIVITVGVDAVNEGNAATSVTFTIQDTLTPTLTPRQASIMTDESVVVDVTFTEDVTGLALNDFMVDVGTVSGLTGSDDTYEVTITAPTSGTGVITLTLRANASVPRNRQVTATIAYTEPVAFVHLPTRRRLTIAGQDLTDRIRGISPVGKTLDRPGFGNFRSSEIQISLDNLDQTFSPTRSTNFFTNNSLPHTGNGATVLLEVQRRETESYVPVFAGLVREVNVNVATFNAVLRVFELVSALPVLAVENFGLSVTKVITDFEGAASDYADDNPVFRFPDWYKPIVPGSVSDVMNGATSVTLVDEVREHGMLRDNYASIDYVNGLIRFEAPPGEDAAITATWKTDYRYLRPDALAKRVIEHSDIHTKMGLTEHPQQSIERAAFDVTDAAFSSHGRPYWQGEGVARWLMHDSANEKYYATVDRDLVEYDEQTDGYTLLGTTPDDTTVTQPPPGGFGTTLEDDTFTLPANLSSHFKLSIAVSPTRIYVGTSPFSGVGQNWVRVFDHNGSHISSEDFNPPVRPHGLSYYDGLLYMGSSFAFGNIRIYNYNPVTQMVGASFITLSGTDAGSQSVLGITSDRIYVVNRSTPGNTTITNLLVFNHSGNQISSEGFEIYRSVGNTHYVVGIALSPSYMFFYMSGPSYGTYNIRAFTYSGTFTQSRSIDNSDLDNTDTTGGLEFFGRKLYSVSLRVGNNVVVVSADDGLNYERFVPYQFDRNGNDFYLLATNTLRGDISRDSTFNSNRILKLSGTTWTNLLNNTKGMPQLAHAVQNPSEVVYRADNRKTGLKVVSHAGKTLIIFRASLAAQSSIRMFNETDDALTHIHSETHANTRPYLPYAMDFFVVEETDGIYVYSFVPVANVSVTDFTGGTLRIYRRRISPLADATQIYTESFAGTLTEYPVSVSGVVLANDKWYFVLEYFAETGRSRSELCTIAKDGSGSRTVIKSYAEPFLAARSPVVQDNKVYYLEGGWHRLPKSSTEADVPDTEHYYPNTGGNLVEVLSDDSDVTDHGLVWREGSQSDSPDPDNADVYAGWGRFNAVVSNMISDGDNLHFVAGFGLPFRTANNLPGIATDPALQTFHNFMWLQWGTELATKVRSFPTTGATALILLERLARSINYEFGTQPSPAIITAMKAANNALTDWQANASFFFRPRTIRTGTLRTAILATGTAAITIDADSELSSEYPDNSRLIIDREIFAYTTKTADANGFTFNGVQRSRHGSNAAAHGANTRVYAVDWFYDPEDIVSVDSVNPDRQNIYNVIRIGDVEKRDATSITTNNERLYQPDIGFSLANDWADELADRLLALLKDIQPHVVLKVVLNPSIRLGQLMTIDFLRQVSIDYTKFRIINVSHDLQMGQTTIMGRGIEALATAAAVTGTATTLTKVSGDNQSGEAGDTLSNPFRVQVDDENGVALGGVIVTFAVASGGGSLNETIVTTNQNGQASVILTLGSQAGTNTVTASASGITATVTFTATGQ